MSRPLALSSLRLPLVWQSQYPPNSQPTDITLSQFLSIQEKGVSAWSFEPDYESNPALIVQSRTEITFLSDGVGMTSEEGGGCCVQSNLPLPKLNDVYYWECKMFEKPVGTEVGIGLATKPFPSFRMPGTFFHLLPFFDDMFLVPTLRLTFVPLFRSQTQAGTNTQSVTSPRTVSNPIPTPSHQPPTVLL